MTAHTADALRRALEHDEIVPYFQPLVDLHGSRLVGFEVLARWCVPGEKPVFPEAFVPLAERAGLIGPLTEHLLHRACGEAMRWPRPVRLSVNISPVELHDRDLPERLRRAAEATGFPLDQLVFEITEAVLIGDLDLARSIAGEVKSLGAKLALDDFGAGHSGLRLLQGLPIDRLKIDASFVRAMTYHRESRKIVAAVIGLAQSLGLGTTAEGIESRVQADMLAGLGCELGQGWLFGRPLSAEAASALMANAEAPLGEDPQPVSRIAEDIALRLEAMPSQGLGQLQALYDGAPVALGFLDTGLRYRALNERLAAIHARPVADHLGRGVAEIIPDMLDRIAPELHRALAGEAVTDCLVHQPNAAVAEQVFLYSYQPVRDPAGEIIGISVAVVDLNESCARRDCASGSSCASPNLALLPRMTPRQLQVLHLLAEGHSVKQIARMLGLAPGTVKTHLTRLYIALGARNRAEAVKRAGLAEGGAGGGAS